MPKMHAIGIQKQDRTTHSVRLRLDQPNDIRQNLGEGGARCNFFKNLVLTGKEDLDAVGLLSSLSQSFSCPQLQDFFCSSVSVANHTWMFFLSTIRKNTV